MRRIYYIINVLGSRGTFQLEMHEQTVAVAYVVVTGLIRAFPEDTITLHEAIKDIKAKKLTLRKVYPRS